MTNLKKFTFPMLDKRGNVMVEISPDDARSLLEDHNPRNRTVKESGVRRWTRELKAGNWDPDASDIKIDHDGNLIDGQHRLLACVRSGVPLGTLLRTGLDPRTQSRVDVGMKRTTADTFRIAGVSWATNIAAAILLRIRYQEGEAQGKRISSDLRIDPLTSDESLDYLRAHPLHEKMATPADSMYRIGPGIARTVYFAALPMFAEVDEADAIRFADAFVDGEWGGPGSPMQALVRYLSSARTPGVPVARARNINERHLLALVKAWNAWRLNQPLDRLKVGDSEALVPVA